MSEFQNGSYKKKKILKHETLYGNDDGYGNCNTQVMIFFFITRRYIRKRTEGSTEAHLLQNPTDKDKDCSTTKIAYNANINNLRTVYERSYEFLLVNIQLCKS